ncbi:hypothetical protein RB653_010093 [Dictyostelium firmibasis]|uniref:Uncharacterized protein n=1 Tax=Dictyostelium firmibasis TaxID=79012 RepID=A0AAN7TKF5_9MYCE
MENQNKQYWYVTGCTSGTGLALTKKLLSLGHKVTGTSRNLKKLEELPFFKDESFLGVQVDLVNRKSVKDSIDKAIKHFGTLTHVINNAGYGLIGAIEEVTEEENRELMDALYFGPINVIVSVLPHFREKKNGYIFNVSSIGGIKAYPGFGNYSAAKFALAGMSEALAADVKPFGIKVTCIILGYIVTGFQNGNQACKHLIPEYKTLEVGVPQMRIYENTLVKGDVNKVADVIIENSIKPELPYNLFIGPIDTFTMAEAKVNELKQQIESQKERNSKVVLEK